MLRMAARACPDLSADNPQNFLSKFNYVSGVDPANGFVHYADPDWAGRYVCRVPQRGGKVKTDFLPQNLTPTTATSTFLKVDTALGVNEASTGRLSVRLSSKTTYDKGLFIFDIKHTPYGCATWPALWLVE